jgi:thioredoxin-related protein
MKHIPFFSILIAVVVTAHAGPKCSPPDSTHEAIQFDQSARWQQVLKKARKTGKYIFVDCYATWCGPCKLMDKEVYTDLQVAAYFESHFISVKFQMDKSTKDDQQTRSRYPDVETIQDKYGVPVYPTYLFFSPDGHLISRAIGYKAPLDFMTLAQSAVDPRGSHPYARYYEMLAKYEAGKRDLSELVDIVDTATLLDQRDVVTALEKDIKDGMGRLHKDELYTRRYIAYIASHTKSSADSFFHLFYPNGERVDTLMANKGYSKRVVERIILKEEIDPVIHLSGGLSPQKGQEPELGNPDWDGLAAKIALKYNRAYSDESIIRARVQWCDDHREWSDCAKWLTMLTRQFPIYPSTEQRDLFLNSECWNAVFRRSTNKDEIDAAIICMQGVMNSVKEGSYAPFEFLDTYANLLYKADRTQQAIEQEELAVKTCIEWKQMPSTIQEFQTTLEKMKNGVPTWPHYIDKNKVF